MRRSSMEKQAVLLLTLILIIQAQVSLHLDHPLPSQSVKRRSFPTHNIPRIQMASDLSPGSDQTKEEYSLENRGYFFSLNMLVGGFAYRLNIDTGSSDTFIKGENSPGAPQGGRYSCSQCMKQNQRVTLKYLQGKVQAYIVNLQMKLGWHKFNQSVDVAYNAQGDFQDVQGIIGLSFPQLAENKNPTFLQTLKNYNIIQSQSFGINLNLQQSHRSIISFGAPDSALFEGTLKRYNFVEFSGHQTTSIKISGFSFSDRGFLPIDVTLLDSGNTCISISNHFIQEIVYEFNKNHQNSYNSGFLRLLCKVIDYQSLPVFRIKVKQDLYEIDKNSYMQSCKQEGDGDHCVTYFETFDSDEKAYKLLLGLGFLNRYYAYFDIEKRQLGLAKNKQILSYKNSFVQSELYTEFFNQLE